MLITTLPPTKEDEVLPSDELLEIIGRGVIRFRFRRGRARQPFCPATLQLVATTEEYQYRSSREGLEDGIEEASFGSQSIQPLPQT